VGIRQVRLTCSLPGNIFVSNLPEHSAVLSVLFGLTGVVVAQPVCKQNYQFAVLLHISIEVNSYFHILFSLVFFVVRQGNRDNKLQWNGSLSQELIILISLALSNSVIQLRIFNFNIFILLFF
jgi:hypothetical protein